MAVDLIGPWTVKVNGVESELNALTIIDTDFELQTTHLAEKLAARKFLDTNMSMDSSALRC